VFCQLFPDGQPAFGGSSQNLVKVSSAGHVQNAHSFGLVVLPENRAELGMGGGSGLGIPQAIGVAIVCDGIDIISGTPSPSEERRKKRIARLPRHADITEISR
jgi:hypothetical protein